MCADQLLFEKEEDIPVSTHVFLQDCIGVLKREITAKAAVVAKIESPPEERRYVVTEEHIKRVIYNMGLARILPQ